MEGAHLKPFLESSILFSLLYDNYEKNLMEELWNVHKHMKIHMTEIYNMPTYMRRAYIQIHNKMNMEEAEEMEMKKNGWTPSTTKNR